MRLNVLTASGDDTGKKVNLSPQIFEIEPNDNAVHSAVIAELAHLRQGSRATKNKAEVQGSGRKPWRQKGTGRARIGTIRSPIWRGGGHTFALKPGISRHKINKKVKQLAKRSAFSTHAKAGSIRVIEELNFEDNKTKQMRNLLQSLQINGGSALLLVKELNENVLLAARNLRNLMVVRADYSSTLDLLSSKTLIIETGAVEIINKMFDQTKKTAEREVQ